MSPDHERLQRRRVSASKFGTDDVILNNGGNTETKYVHRSAEEFRGTENGAIGMEDTERRKGDLYLSPLCPTTTLWLPITTALPLLVVIDMIGVSLVVPLLPQYFRLAGVSNASQRELLSSLFSSSQIAGGLVLGAMSDSGVLSRRMTLMLSFSGSAIAYFLISHGGLVAMMSSRIIVGFVKQTMTVSTALMSKNTTKDERAIQVGRLSASSTVAWIVGPSLGAFLYKHVSVYAPVYVSCVLFMLNVAIAFILIPADQESDELSAVSTTLNNDMHRVDGSKINSEKTKKISKLMSNVKECFTSDRYLAYTIGALLVYHWVTRTTSYANIATYYESRYGIEPYQRGFLQSYKMALSFVAQSILVRPLLAFAGGEANGACLAAAAMTMITFVELYAPFSVFIILLCPLISVAVALLGVSLRSLVSQVGPKNSLGSIFASIDVLQNATAVTVPFYRTVLFSLTRPDNNWGMTAMKGISGDPEPRRWLISSSIHWLFASFALSLLLKKDSTCADGGEGTKDDRSIYCDKGNDYTRIRRSFSKFKIV